ncbi:MAG: hypothetical protein PHH70_01630, partial [Candidatus Gracilibacteria bacterium]|nr:hypothetical protein [Candidatus Gracilibacteria bacterium]
TNLVSSSTGYIMKKDSALKNMDSSLAGYWDMETLTSSGLLKDLSGNGWDGTCYNNNVQSGACSGTGPILLSGGMLFDGAVGKSVRILNSTGMINGGDKITIIGVMSGYCKTNGNCNILRSGLSGTDVKSLRFSNGKVGGELSTTTYHSFGNPNTAYSVLGAMTYDGSKVKIYTNGVPSISYDCTGSLSQTDLDWFIGKKTLTDSNGTFSGAIYEIKIYNRAFSEAEIKQQTRAAGF